jgi:ATP-dependent Clp protease adapter protein ClpS
MKKKHTIMNYDINNILESIAWLGLSTDGIDGDTEVIIPETDTDDLTKMLEEVGISTNNGGYNLILLNDDKNDMLTIIVALYQICHLSNEKAKAVMLEAHEKGRAIAKTGTLEEMNEMKKALNERNIGADVEKNDE